MASSSSKPLTCATGPSLRSSYTGVPASGARTARPGRFSGVEVPASCVDVCRGRCHRHDHARASSRRAKSHSPARRAPKLQHMHGRLDVRPTVALETALALCEEDADLDGEMLRGLSSTEKAELLSPREDVHRTCSSPTSLPAHRFKIFYRDEALYHTCEQNTRRIIAAARRAEQSDNQGDPHGLHCENSILNNDVGEASDQQQQLALKALKYRKLLNYTRRIDEKMLRDPSFDVLEFLGAKWCKM